MANHSDTGIKNRILRMIRLLIERPNYYTRKQLADKFGVDDGTITNDLLAFRNAGFDYSYDKRYRYSLIEDKPLKQLETLLHFTEEDRTLLHAAIDQLPYNSESQKSLKRKLSTLYDFKQLGLNYLRKPYLTKIDLLTEAKINKKKVRLIGYRSSNSNVISDRLVEPFEVDAETDTVQTYDIDKTGLRHFRISRILRVEVSQEDWANEGSHNIRPTDPFRIVDNKQVRVHLRMKIGAYNELIERFPQSKGHFEASAEQEGVYDFECKVNHEFRGLTNFILGFHHQIIEIVSPEELRIHLRDIVRKIKF